MAWSSTPATAFFMVLLIIIVTIAACIFFPFGNFEVMVGIFFVEGIALLVPFALYHHKAGEYPGIYEAYEEWRRRIAEQSGD